MPRLHFGHTTPLYHNHTALSQPYLSITTNDQFYHHFNLAVGDETTMIEEAHKVLEDVPEEEEFYVEYDPLTAGNRSIIPFADFPREVEIFKAELASTQMKLDFVKMVVAEHGRRLASLHTRIGNLSKSVDGYKNIRHNFIDKYVRSTTSGMATRTRKQRQEGKGATHVGDAEADANLYRDDKERNDFTVFEELYGVLPQVVWYCTHMETINVLNIHAGIKADQGESMNPRFYGLFDDFIKAWESAGFAINYLDEGVKDSHVAAVNKAYWAFHEFLENEEWRKGEEAPKRGRAAGEGRATLIFVNHKRATDGLDDYLYNHIKNLMYVINYDLVQNIDESIHRIVAMRTSLQTW
ncbi:hypothetical protein B9Z19DRAFT_1109377 [Tuber borchii]|uniref:Uncharacterized protein n=1 Tax=Tuber borchii TaxID=42251 RepID=A0A2T6ZMB8_TUBBO|nr:hypothetical protein B9Z19DRAFT_1109377 [Tuber borchii]